MVRNTETRNNSANEIHQFLLDEYVLKTLEIVKETPLIEIDAFSIKNLIKLLFNI